MAILTTPIINKRYGKLLVLAPFDNRHSEVLCRCGNIRVMRNDAVKDKKTSCGCAHKTSRQHLYTETRKYWFSRCWASWRGGARTRGIEWNLTKPEVLKIWEKQQGLCYYTGVELEILPKYITTASLDRIDSSKGYTIDNIVFTSKVFNRMKCNFSLEVLMFMCKGFVIKHDEQTRQLLTEVALARLQKH